jgi:electron transport complex protein RnfG
MVGIGILCALLIVLTYEGTLPRIEKLRAEALEKAIFKVLPGTSSTATFYLQEDNTFSTTPGVEGEGSKVYAGFDDNNDLVGVAIEGSGQGYADIIKVLYGYDPDEEKVIGFYVLESKETPGLGDKIEKDAKFLANFEALDVKLESNNKLVNKIIPVKSGEKNNPWEVDGITGATISSRAIGNIFGSSTEQWVPLIYKSKDSFVSSTQGNK